jgi:hypothetical protein
MASSSGAAPYYHDDISYVGEEVANSYEEPTSASDQLLILILWLLPVRLYLITMTISLLSLR